MLGLYNLENTVVLCLRCHSLSHKYETENIPLATDLRNRRMSQHERQGPLKNDPFRMDKHKW